MTSNRSTPVKHAWIRVSSAMPRQTYMQKGLIQQRFCQPRPGGAAPCCYRSIGARGGWGFGGGGRVARVGGHWARGTTRRASGAVVGCLGRITGIAEKSGVSNRPAIGSPAWISEIERPVRETRLWCGMVMVRSLAGGHISMPATCSAAGGRTELRASLRVNDDGHEAGKSTPLVDVGVGNGCGS